MKEKKLPVYKRLNKDAEIMGFPFMVFFILLFFTIISVMIVFSSPIAIAILWIVTYFIFVAIAIYVFKKYGLKYTLKKVELYFRNPIVIKYNQTFWIKKIDLDL